MALRYGGSKRVTDPKEIKLCVKKALVAVIKARNLELKKFQDPTLEKPSIDNIKQLEGSWASGWKVGEQKVDWKLDLGDLEFRFAVSALLLLQTKIMALLKLLKAPLDSRLRSIWPSRER